MQENNPKAALVKELRKEGYPLNNLLKAIKLSRSTYYYEISKPDYDEVNNADIVAEIKAIFEKHKYRYGVRRVHGELQNKGYKINHKKVQRLMNKYGLMANRPKEKYHSYKGNVGKIADNVINRDFSTSKPFEKWTTDVTQFSFSWGKCYLSPILDMHTNEIISYNLSLSPNMNQVTDMLSKAFRKHKNLEGLIFHSDQGWQYQQQTYIQTLKRHGIIQSMSRKGNCYDNCIMETFFGRLKNEMFYGHEKEFKSYAEFKKAVDSYIRYYNYERIQSKTKWMPPVIYRKASIC